MKFIIDLTAAQAYALNSCPHPLKKFIHICDLVECEQNELEDPDFEFCDNCHLNQLNDCNAIISIDDGR